MVVEGTLAPVGSIHPTTENVTKCAMASSPTLYLEDILTKIYVKINLSQILFKLVVYNQVI